MAPSAAATCDVLVDMARSKYLTTPFILMEMILIESLGTVLPTRELMKDANTARTASLRVSSNDSTDDVVLNFNLDVMISTCFVTFLSMFSILGGGDGGIGGAGGGGG